MIPAEYADRVEPFPGYNRGRTVQDEGAAARIERREEMRFARGHLRALAWHVAGALRSTGVSLRTRLWMAVFWTFLPVGRVLCWIGLSLWIRRQAWEWDRHYSRRSCP